MHHSLSNSQLRGVWEVRNVLSTDYTKPFLALLRVININGHITGTMVAGKQIRRSHLIDPTHHLLIFPEKLKRATPHKGVGKTKTKRPGATQDQDSLEIQILRLFLSRFPSNVSYLWKEDRGYDSKASYGEMGRWVWSSHGRGIERSFQLTKMEGRLSIRVTADLNIGTGWIPEGFLIRTALIRSVYPYLLSKRERPSHRSRDPPAGSQCHRGCPWRWTRLSMVRQDRRTRLR